MDPTKPQAESTSRDERNDADDELTENEAQSDAEAAWARARAVLDSVERDVRLRDIELERVNDRIDQARLLAEQMPDDVKRQTTAFVETNGLALVGLFHMGAEEDDEALNSLREAERLAAAEKDFLEGEPGEEADSWRQTFEVVGLIARKLALDLRLKAATDPEQVAKLETDRDLTIARLAELAPGQLHDHPDAVKRAISLLTRADQMAFEMDLDGALDAANRARVMFGELKRNVSANAEMIGIADTSAHLGAFEKFAEAHRVSFQVERDAILGQPGTSLSQTVDAALETLSQAADEHVKAGQTLKAVAGRPVPIEAVADGIESERRRLLNMRNLLAIRNSTRERAKRAAPVVIAFFIITFLVTAIGLRWTGLVDQLEGTDLLYLLGIAVVVAFAGAFGSGVAIQVIDAFAKWIPGTRTGREDETRNTLDDEPTEPKAEG